MGVSLNLFPCYSTLVESDRYDAAKIVGDLAESWDTPDPLTYIFHLRKGVMFHDGSLLDANDVIASWAAGIDASNPNHYGRMNAWEYYSYLWGGLMNEAE